MEKSIAAYPGLSKKKNIFRLENKVGTPRERGRSYVKHLAIKDKCGIGERGQTPKTVTGLENEVTPRQLLSVPTNFHSSNMCFQNIIEEIKCDKYR